MSRPASRSDAFIQLIPATDFRPASSTRVHQNGEYTTLNDSENSPSNFGNLSPLSSPSTVPFPPWLQKCFGNGECEWRNKRLWVVIAITLLLGILILSSTRSSKKSNTQRDSTTNGTAVNNTNTTTITTNTTIPEETKISDAEKNVPKRRNVILMISDGFGPASETIARNYFQTTQNPSSGFQLPLDTMLVGSSRTRSASSLVTDSAAGATAFSCTQKTYNEAVGVDVDGKPCGTILEAAKGDGYKTGLVVTSRITHATPASFNAHVPWRSMESEIAVQQLFGYNSKGRVTDIMMGGGSCFFVPQHDHVLKNETALRELNKTGSTYEPDPVNLDVTSCRLDDRNLILEAEKAGWNIVMNRSVFDHVPATVKLPLMALFTSDHMSFELDRDPKKEPSLAEMVYKTIQILHEATHSKNDSKGFFLMVEGSRIDMAAHTHDPFAHIQDILAYNEAVRVVREYIDANPETTVMISVSDHETGGLSAAKQLNATKYPEYRWRPHILENITMSAELAAHTLQAGIKRPLLTQEYAIGEILVGNLGLFPVDGFVPFPGYDLTPPTRTHLQPSRFFTKDDVTEIMKRLSSVKHTAYYLGQLMSENAELGWSTHGHSAVDVNLYTYDGRDKSSFPVRADANLTWLLPFSPKTFLKKPEQFFAKSNISQGTSIGVNATLLSGNVENTDVGAWIASFLDLNLNSVTQKLNK